MASLLKTLYDDSKPLADSMLLPDKGVFEPKLPHQFTVGIDVDGVNLPAWLVKSVSIPGANKETISVNHINQVIKFAGKQTFPDIKLTLYDAIRPSAAQKVEDWMRSSYEPDTGRAGYSSNYKTDAICIYQLGAPGDPVTKWRLIGAWCKDRTNTAADASSSSTPSVIDITISIDRYQLEY